MYCLVLSCGVLSCLVLWCLVVSCGVLSCLVVFCLVLSCGVLSCLVLSCLVLSCLVVSCRVVVVSCLVLSCLGLSCLVVSCSGLLFGLVGRVHRSSGGLGDTVHKERDLKTQDDDGSFFLSQKRRVIVRVMGRLHVHA